MEQQYRRLEDIVAHLQAIEKRLLTVIRDAGTGAMSREQVGPELILLAGDLRGVYRRIQARLERRDLSYDDQARLKDLRAHCTWLYRKARMEEIFFRKLELEERLRQTIPDEAYAIYLALQEAEEEQHCILSEDPGAEHGFGHKESDEEDASRFATAMAWVPEQ